MVVDRAGLLPQVSASTAPAALIEISISNRLRRRRDVTDIGMSRELLSKSVPELLLFPIPGRLLASDALPGRRGAGIGFKSVEPALCIKFVPQERHVVAGDEP